MADRKQFLGVVQTNPALLETLKVSRTRTVSEDELREQRVSFAFGNSFNSKVITKDSVRHASQNVRIFSTNYEPPR
jgi:hypothetical protein